MYKVYVALSKLGSLTSLLEANATAALRENFIKELEAIGRDFEKFCQLVESTLDIDQAGFGKRNTYKNRNCCRIGIGSCFSNNRLSATGFLTCLPVPLTSACSTCQREKV